MEDVFGKCMQVAEKPSRKRAMPAGTDFFSPMRTSIQSDEQHYCNTIVESMDIGLL